MLSLGFSLFCGWLLSLHLSPLLHGFHLLSPSLHLLHLYLCDDDDENVVVEDNGAADIEEGVIDVNVDVEFNVHVEFHVDLDHEVYYLVLDSDHLFSSSLPIPDVVENFGDVGEVVEVLGFVLNQGNVDRGVGVKNNEVDN